jgi:hypothetical protein
MRAAQYIISQRKANALQFCEVALTAQRRIWAKDVEESRIAEYQVEQHTSSTPGLMSALACAFQVDCCMKVAGHQNLARIAPNCIDCSASPGESRATKSRTR